MVRLEGQGCLDMWMKNLDKNMLKLLLVYSTFSPFCRYKGEQQA